MKNYSETMFVAPVTETEVEQVIKGLKNKSSPGFDEIPTFLVKQCLTHSFSILSDDRFKASSKTIPPHSAI
jgi:hypothetical protein